MKAIKFFAVIFTAVCLASCGSEGITPVSEKIQGPLGEFFQVVNKDYKAKEDKVCIEIKRIKAGFPAPWKEGMEVGYSDGQFEPQFTADFQDADGSVVCKSQTDIVFSKEELSVIAALGVDETATITFSVSEGAAQVKMGSTFKVHGDAETTVNLAGSIGKYPIKMTLHIASDGEVTGAYYYMSKGPGHYLYLKGTKDGDKITLDEYNKEGKHTGDFTGSYTNNIYRGAFKAKSGDYEFVLSPDNEMQTIDLSTVDFSDFSDFSESSPSEDDWSSDGDFTSSSDSEDWGAILDAYDSYVTKYISYVKKAANGDMTALAEYPALLEKAQELNSRLEGAKGDMSASQQARYLKITAKLSQAAQEMR